MVIPATYAVTLYQGTDFSRSFTFPFDLSAYPTIQLDIRTGPGGTRLLGLDLDHGLAVGGTGNQTLVWTMTDAETAALPTGYKPAYDVRLTDANGLEAVYFGGRITVTPRVTTGAAT